MAPEDITLVLQRTLEHLHQHFEREMIPDDEFIPLIGVVIGSGTSLLEEARVPLNAIRRIEKQLLEQAKTAWLASCAHALLPSDNKPAVLAVAAKDFDRLYRRSRKKGM